MGLFSSLKERLKAKKESTYKKYDRSLSKSRAAFADKLDALAKRYQKVDEEYFEELEEILIEADVGVKLTLSLIDTLLSKAEKEGLSDPKKINEELIDLMFVSYVESGESIVNEISFVKGTPTVLLMVGVNGVGKTTTIAKLAKRYLKQNKKVMLVAADTFRAGASEQLSIWAERLSCPIILGKPNSDPASVAYDGVKYAKENNIDLCIIDTAGRLQNKTNLMQELAKIKRVIAREIESAPQETFLVIDASTGQNGVTQAKAFKEVCDLTGVVITKMDGTSKGGILLSIREEISLPVRFIGLGEGMDDLEEFDLDSYLHGLLIGEKL